MGVYLLALSAVEISQMSIFKASITRQFASGKLSEQARLAWSFLADTKYISSYPIFFNPILNPAQIVKLGKLR